MDLVIKKYPVKDFIVAVSGGPDSMALLDILRKNHYNLVIAHVNYHTRPESNNEEELVRKYANDYNIKIEVASADNLKNIKGNFQDNARIFRYQFFREVSNKYQIFNIALGQHKDDNIETYLMQKERQVNVQQYGIYEVRKFLNLTLYRPLINFYKEEIVSYNLENSLEYGVDSSNELLIYRRNIVRNNLKNLSIAEKEKIIAKMNLENSSLALSKEAQKLLDFYDKEKYLTISNYNFLAILEKERLLNQMTYPYLNQYLSNKHFLEFDKALNSSKSQVKLKLNDSYSLDKVYDKVLIQKVIEVSNYHFNFNLGDKEIITEYFILNKLKGIDYIDIPDCQFPLTISSVSKEDYLIIKDKHKQVRRFFIDHKVGKDERKILPIIKNNQMEIIYIPTLYKKIWKEFENINKIRLFYDRIMYME